MTYLRKRPRQARSVATFEAVVEAAARILSRQGPGHLTTNHIAARAGVSVGSLYQYFPDRGAIVRALVERQITAAEALRPPALDDPDLPLERRLRLAIDWHFDLHAADPRLARELQRLAADVLPVAERRRLAELRARRIARAIAPSAADGDGGADEASAMAAFIVDVCLEALTEAATARRPQWLSAPRFRSEVAALVGRYLAGRAAAPPTAKLRCASVPRAKRR